MIGKCVGARIGTCREGIAVGQKIVASDGCYNCFVSPLQRYITNNVQLCDLCISHRIACQITVRIFDLDDPVDAVGRSVIGACFGNAALLHGDGILGLVALQRTGCALGRVDNRTGAVCACHGSHSYIIGQLIRLVISERRQPCDRKALAVCVVGDGGICILRERLPVDFDAARIIAAVCGILCGQPVRNGDRLVMRTIWGIDCNGVAYLTFVFRKGVLFLCVQRILRLNGVGFLAQMYLAVATGLCVIDRGLKLEGTVELMVRIVIKCKCDRRRIFCKRKGTNYLIV